MQDFRLASRTLRRSPGFTIIAILILGIGGIASSFTIVDCFLLTPLPFDDPERLVHLYRTDPQSGGTEGRFALPMIAAMRNGTDSLVDLGAYQYGGRNLADDSGDPQHLMVGTLTTNVLGILGIETGLRAWFRAAGRPRGR
jgi:putative ABC transport system permease protein